MSVSLDGFVGGPNGELDWLFKSMDENVEAWQLETLSQAGVHIMGSRTYYDMVSYWPTSKEPIATPMNTIPKVVFTQKGNVNLTGGGEPTPGLKDALKDRPVEKVTAKDLGNWANTRVAGGELAEEVLQLKQEPGKDIFAHGGAGFAQSLIKEGLVDEYRLLVHPVALGKGLPLFGTLPKPLNLALLRTTVFKSGAVAKIYQPMT